MGNLECAQNCMKDRNDEEKIEIQGIDCRVQNAQDSEAIEDKIIFLENLRVNIASVVKLQCRIRSFLAKIALGERQLETSIVTQSSVIELEEVPRRLRNRTVRNILDALGPFANSQADLPHTTRRGPTRLVDGSVYVGTWNVNGEPHGSGTMYHRDGTVSEGAWKKGKLSGLGRRVQPTGDVYVGSWLDGKRSGHGVMKYAEAQYQYIGEWLNDYQHGKGEEVWADGSTFKGTYNIGSREGRGEFKWADGNCYSGQFANDEISGYGKYSWNTGRQYDGEWKHNLMHGTGVFSWSDGRSYKGSYAKDKKEGWGVFEWPNGERYEGYWKHGKQHGEGTLFRPAGAPKHGQWEFGKLVRKL